MSRSILGVMVYKIENLEIKRSRIYTNVSLRLSGKWRAGPLSRRWSVYSKQFKSSKPERDNGQGIHLREIATRSRQIAKLNVHVSNWRIPDSSIRRCMNMNTVGKGHNKWYVRVGGEESRSGYYVLSETGRLYRAKLEFLGQ